MAVSLKKPRKAWLPPRRPGGRLYPRELSPGDPGYTPQLQGLINKGQIPYGPVASLGYTPPPAGATGPAIPPPPKLTQQQYIQQGLEGDWRVINARQAKESGMAGLRGNFQAALRAALVNLGVIDPNELTKLGLGQYIDADTIT